MTRTNREMVQIFFHPSQKKTLEMYSLLLETYIKDANVKRKLFNPIENITCVTRQAKWAINWIASTTSFAETLLKSIFLQHVRSIIGFSHVGEYFFFLSGSFGAIFWLKRGGLMPGLTFSNELISTQEMKVFTVIIQVSC
ncbi:ribonucleoside-diphosphate reductase small chain [Iris pallida]|uniref:Ribonucleoside-diphosphate reductase small chain n=1 Tax=Iris pallida TaxID=29817 RepID=A0AAX6DG96_IRIPA|nr:ribonucleoside-diphosphate reductase small chain [Iris pallida]